ncbi:MAG TPA: DegV family protein [Propionibacteriaceae bacterium]|jgi:DegV family protein with EDD domain|nr:DegV family protein [Propionibacteriaceae bacterium]
MAEVALVTDSTSSLEPEEARSAGVTVVPLQVVIDGKSRPESDVPAAEVATALRAGRTVSTSRPSPETFAAAYADRAEQGATAVVSVHLSAEISGTCAAAERAASDAAVPVTVVDCRTLAMAAGFAVLSAAAAASSGSEAGAVAQVAQDRAAASTTYFYVDTLEFLRRGGRIGPAAAMLGSALSVKPLLTVSDGQIRPCERVRTESRALARLEELSLSALAAAAGGSEHVDVAVHHLDNAEGAARLVGRLQDRVRGSEVAVREVSAVIGVHVGPGMLGVVVAPSTNGP